MLRCTVCGEWYPPRGRDTSGFCAGCKVNFSGAQPPMFDPEPPPRQLPPPALSEADQAALETYYAHVTRTYPQVVRGLVLDNGEGD